MFGCQQAAGGVFVSRFLGLGGSDSGAGPEPPSGPVRERGGKGRVASERG